MTTFECAGRLRYYGKKCEQHLSRVRLSHLLALRGAHIDAPAPDSGVDKLTRAAFDDSESDLLNTKLRRELHELHLMSLKSDFELYLNRVLTVLWTAHFAILVPKARSQQVALRDIGEAAVQGISVLEFAIERILPTHGLNALADALTNATDIRLPDAAGAFSQWSQIRVAFEVRHLVEHRDGKVDADFRKHVDQFWANSTWGKRDPAVASVGKIVVEEQDVVDTYGAMCNATQRLTDALVQWDRDNHDKGRRARRSRVSRKR
jgi:hypothetical protein